MSKVQARPVSDVFWDFSDYLTQADLYSMKALSDITVALVKKRISFKMNQKQFAEFMGVSQGMVSKWESSDYNFTIKSAAALCEKLGLKFEVSLTPEKESSCFIMGESDGWVNEEEKEVLVREAKKLSEAS